MRVVRRLVPPDLVTSSRRGRGPASIWTRFGCQLGRCVVPNIRRGRTSSETHKAGIWVTGWRFEGAEASDWRHIVLPLAVPRRTFAFDSRKGSRVVRRQTRVCLYPCWKCHKSGGLACGEVPGPCATRPRLEGEMAGDPRVLVHGTRNWICAEGRGLL